MRLLVISVALLAGLKVWTQDRMVRSALGETIVAAYRQHAADVCHRSAPPSAKSGGNSWASPEIAEVVIGDAAADVAMWDIDNPMWDVRFRHPHLILKTTGREPRQCAFDLVAGLASVRPR